MPFQPSQTFGFKIHPVRKECEDRQQNTVAERSSQNLEIKKCLEFRYKRKVIAAPTHETTPQSCHRSKRPPMRAPHAGRMTYSCRSPGSRIPPFTGPSCKRVQWHFWRRIHRLQLRAQLRNWPAVKERQTAPNSHLPVKVTGKSEPFDLKRSQSFCQRNPYLRKTIQEFRDGACVSRNISKSLPPAWGSSPPPVDRPCAN